MSFREKGADAALLARSSSFTRYRLSTSGGSPGQRSRLAEGPLPSVLLSQALGKFVRTSSPLRTFLASFFSSIDRFPTPSRRGSRPLYDQISPLLVRASGGSLSGLFPRAMERLGLVQRNYLLCAQNDLEHFIPFPPTIL